MSAGGGAENCTHDGVGDLRLVGLSGRRGSDGQVSAVGGEPAGDGFGGVVELVGDASEGGPIDAGAISATHEVAVVTHVLRGGHCGGGPAPYMTDKPTPAKAAAAAAMFLKRMSPLMSIHARRGSAAHAVRKAPPCWSSVDGGMESRTGLYPRAPDHYRYGMNTPGKHWTKK
jgi:hypothetical protein